MRRVQNAHVQSSYTIKKYENIRIWSCFWLYCCWQMCLNNSNVLFFSSLIIYSTLQYLHVKTSQPHTVCCCTNTIAYTSQTIQQNHPYSTQSFHIYHQVGADHNTHTPSHNRNIWVTLIEMCGGGGGLNPRHHAATTFQLLNGWLIGGMSPHTAAPFCYFLANSFIPPPSLPQVVPHLKKGES